MNVPTAVTRLHEKAVKAGWLVEIHTAAVLIKERNVDSVAVELRKGDTHIQAQWEDGAMAQLIESSTQRGELVLDPFGGVGSTGVAALLIGRRCIVIEKDEGYARVAAERIAEAEAWVGKAAAL